MVTALHAPSFHPKYQQLHADAIKITIILQGSVFNVQLAQLLLLESVSVLAILLTSMELVRVVKPIQYSSMGDVNVTVDQLIQVGGVSHVLP